MREKAKKGNGNRKVRLEITELVREKAKKSNGNRKVRLGITELL